MTPRTDPPRLAATSDTPASLRDALREARMDGPSDADRGVVLAGLGSLLGPGGLPGSPAGPSVTGPSVTGPSVTGPSVTGPSVTPAAGLGAGKLIAIVGGAALLAGGITWMSSRPAADPQSASAPIAAVESSDPILVEDTSEPIKPELPTPVAVAIDSGANMRLSALPSEKTSRERHSSVVPTPPPASAAAAPKPSESVLLDSARRALATDPEQTLSYARQHRTLYPQGILAQEREVLVVEALRRLGRNQEAKQHEDSFKSRYPSSIHGRDVPVPEGSAGTSAAKKK